jgi:hypothetical protein
VLRNQTDPQGAATGGATKAELLGLAAVSSPAPPAPARKPGPAAPARARAAAPPPSPPPAPLPEPAAAPKSCVEIVAGPVRRTECF